MSSEPTWIGDGQMFSYDVDTKHVGVFSTALRRVTIVPDATSQHYVTLFRTSTPDAVLVTGVFDGGDTEVTRVELPWLQEGQRFRVGEPLLDIRPDGELLYAVGRVNGSLTDLLELDPRRRRGRRLGGIPGQVMRGPIFLDDWLAFVSTRFDHKLAVRRRDGTSELLADGSILNANHCGNDLIVDRALDDGRAVVDRIDQSGKLIRRLSEGPLSGQSDCSPDGQTWFFADGTSPPRLEQCRETGCRVLAEHSSYGLSVSPDGQRVAFVKLASRGPLVGWMPAAGGATHEVVDTETACAIGWASNQTLWVSRRRDGKFLWTEVDADTGKETGHTVLGQRDCSDGGGDPLSPVNPDLRVIAERVSQLRLLPRAQLHRH